MSVERNLTRPYRVEGGHADFMLKTDVVRRTPGAFRELAELYQQPVLFTEILDSLNLATITSSKPGQTPWEDFHFAHDDDRYFAIGSVVTPQTDPGDPITVALAASEMKVENGRRTSRPRKSEKIIDKKGLNWTIKQKIVNVAAGQPHQLVLEPALKTTTATFLANDRFAILGPTTAEAAGQPTGLVKDFGIYTNRYLIAKETDLTSGTNMTTDVAAIYGVPGLSKYAYIDGIDEASIRHERNKSSLLVHAQISDNWTDYSPDFDAQIDDHNSEGFIQSAELQGHTQTWDVAAGYDMDDFKRAVAKYRQMRLNASDVAVIQGGVVAEDVQDALKDLMGNEVNMKYFTERYIKQRYKSGERFSAEGLFAQFGYNGVGYGNYKFIFREATELNSMFGDDGYKADVDFATYQFFVPLFTRKDSKTNATMPSIQMRHRGQSAGGYQRLNEIWRTGGAGPIQKTDEWDVMRCYFRSEVMLMLIAGKYCIIQKGGTADA